VPFWDPYFGWDYHAMGQAAFVLVGLGLFLGLFGATEHNDAFYLYRGIWAWGERNTVAVLGASIVGFVAGFYYWRMQGGDF